MLRKHYFPVALPKSRSAIGADRARVALTVVEPQTDPWGNPTALSVCQAVVVAAVLGTVAAHATNCLTVGSHTIRLIGLRGSFLRQHCRKLCYTPSFIL
jgi:hypothetical protein